MKIALAGLGGAAGRGHLPAIRHLMATGRARLVAAADPIDDRRAAIRREVPDLPTFRCAREMLESVESDLLVVATQPSAHSRLALLGLQRRRHVLVEKPLALTNHDLQAIKETQTADPGFALVSVHQYQFSPVWMRTLPWLQIANRLGARFTLRVQVQRDGTDRKAASKWRTDARSGGIFADHGTHFLALAWRIGGELKVLTAKRQPRPMGRERAVALVRIGRSGLLEMDLDSDANSRRTRIDVNTLGVRLVWDNSKATLVMASRELHGWKGEALSDRAHVDALYGSIYRHLLAGVNSGHWRQRRRAETFSVAETCISLLTHAEAEAAL